VEAVVVPAGAQTAWPVVLLWEGGETGSP